MKRKRARWIAAAPLFIVATLLIAGALATTEPKSPSQTPGDGTVADEGGGSGVVPQMRLGPDAFAGTERYRDAFGTAGSRGASPIPLAQDEIVVGPPFLYEQAGE